MRDPPDSQKEHHQVTMQMADLRDRTALDVPAPAFSILKGRFDPHAPAIDLDQLPRGRAIRNDDPDFFIARFPTESQRGGKAMLLPDQGRTIPLLAFFFDQLSSTLPGRVASLVLTAHLVLLRDPQHVVPLDL